MNEILDRRAHERINGLEAILIEQNKAIAENTNSTLETEKVTKEMAQNIEVIVDAVRFFRWVNNAIRWVANRLFKLATWAAPIAGLWFAFKDHFQGK